MYVSSSGKSGQQVHGLGTTTSRLLPLRKFNHQPKRSVSSLLSNRRDDRVYCAAVSKKGTPVRPIRKKKKSNREKEVLSVSLPDSHNTSMNTPTINIALDYYSVLKARKINSAEILKRNYENLLSQVPDRMYSKDTVNGRIALLRQAAEIMLDSDKRRDYDQSLSNNEVPSFPVSTKDFPGALLLLYESGNMAQVVELGTQWINQNGMSPMIKDVALSVSKAYCDLASITLSSGEGIAMCCEELEAALDLLRVCKVAPELQQEISNALKELGPQFILEQLAIPEDDPKFTERRYRGLSQLKELLWEVDETGTLSPSLSDRQGFLELARNHLTAAQQIEVFESCPKELMIPTGELYDSAMAYVAEGYRTKWPKHIQSAERVLKQIQMESLTSEFGGSDVSVELALCALLLGHPDRTMIELGLRPGSPKVPDKDVAAFVREHSPSEDDLLPGVCALAEVWLKNTIIPNYKEINTMTSSLGEWFQSPSVSVYLRLIEQGKDLSLNSAVKLSSTMAKGLKSAVSKVVERVHNLFQKPIVEIQNEPESVGRLKLPKVDISRLSQNSAIRIQESSFHYRPQQETKHVPEESPDVLNGEVNDESKEDNLVGNDWWPSGGPEHNYEVQIPETKQSFDQFFEALWKPLAVVSVLLLAAAIGRLVFINSNPDLQSNITSSLTNVVDKVKDYFDLNPQIQGTIDVPLAEELIRRWHVAKSEALGADHDVDQLAEVLQGNMLKQWKERAQSVQQDGWHWEYTLLDLAVDTVSLGRDGRSAVIEANISEKAELIDSGRKADWYSTTYSVQYDLVMKKQGWKISGARVVYQSR
eukprot:g3389.t1